MADQTTQLKQPPQNVDAEASLLGAILIDTDAIVKIADSIKAPDFFEKRHGLIYSAMLSLYEQRSAIDVLTLANQLKSKGELDSIGGASYLTELTNFVPTATHVEQYADIVAQKALRRRLISVSQQMVSLGFDETKALHELIEEAESNLFAVSEQHVKQSVVSLEAILAESFERLDELHKDKKKLRGISTGFKDLDGLLAGFQRSDLFVLAARPSMGKTALMLNFAHNVAVNSKEPVLFFSLEMSKEQLVDRLLSIESGVDAWALRTGNLNDSDFEKIGEAMGTLSEAPIFIDDTPGITVSDLRTKARREAHRHQLGLIVVDYLQLMSGGGRFGSEANRVQEISEISRGLKGIARELNTPLMAASQLNRSVENRSPQIPQLADLRESGCLSGDARITMSENGETVSIRELAERQPFTNLGVLALDETDGLIKPGVALKAYHNGTKQTFALSTLNGPNIRATANHKFFTRHGWKRLDELNTGAEIALNGTANTLRWEKVTTITKAGIEAVYDLSVDSLHSFIANGIVVHNSIEQDADVVAFIYREEFYNPETDRKKITDLLIKKHRNGPVGGVELFFDNEKQRFRSLDTKHNDPF
jgi:replicative DNA helicase